MQKMRMSWQLSCRVMYNFLDLITALHFIDVILQTFEYDPINPLWNTTQACFAVMMVVNEDMRLWSGRTKAWYLLHDIPGMKTMVRVGTDITQQQNRDEMAISLGKYYVWRCLNTTRPKHTGSHFAGDVFKNIFLTEIVFVLNASVTYVLPVTNLTKSHHWLTRWLGSEPAPRHYLNQSNGEPLRRRIYTNMLKYGPQFWFSRDGNEEGLLPKRECHYPQSTAHSG